MAQYASERYHGGFMRSHHASLTATFVAICRSLAPLLPPKAQLVQDPYGIRLAGPMAGKFLHWLERRPAPVHAMVWGTIWPVLPWALYMQIRTRVLDDALLNFLKQGGRQVVILGAGFDARALRLNEYLDSTVVYEIDHPATQAEKHRIFGHTKTVRYLAWDFEKDSMEELPRRLVELGHDTGRPTFTLWEGVTMYLSQEAIEATLTAIRGYSAPGSQVALNYIDRELLEQRSPLSELVRGVVAVVGEPFQSSFYPDELSTLVKNYGFSIQKDDSFADLARDFLPEPWSRLVHGGRRLALSERTAVIRTDQC